MPTSRPYHLTWLCNKVIELKPQSILDIGIGFGSKGMLFREYSDVWYGNYFDWKVRIDGVEIFKKYITPLQKKIYDKIYIGNILELVDKLPYYDMIYMGDVLEHIERQDALELIQKLKTKTRDLIIVTPVNVGQQGSIYGNENETHVSQWSLMDFSDCQVVTIHNSMIIHYRKPQVYCCDSMSFFGGRIINRLKFSPYEGRADLPTLFMGLYFNDDYMVYKQHTGPRYIFWNGSDVYRLLNTPSWQRILQEYPATHICHNKLLADELAQVGIKALIEPIFFANMNDYNIQFKQKKHLEVYINAHPDRLDEYGIPIVLQVAKQLPDMKFYIYGVKGQNTENVHFMGRIDEDKADTVMSKHQVFLRLNQHDGLSQQIIKAGLWGQYVITMTQNIPHTDKVDNISELIDFLQRLSCVTEPNLPLRKYLLHMNINQFSWL